MQLAKDGRASSNGEAKLCFVPHTDCAGTSSVPRV